LDNNSNDQTYDVFLKYNTQINDLKYVKNKVNIGLGANILRAVEYSNSEYTWVICDDDIYDFRDSNDVIETIPYSPNSLTTSPLNLPARKAAGESIPPVALPPKFSILDDTYRSQNPADDLEQAYELRKLLREAITNKERAAALDAMQTAEDFKTMKLRQLEEKYGKRKPR
jgi:glycosyltransferase involved in cell wall biosynthesis